MTLPDSAPKDSASQRSWQEDIVTALENLGGIGTYEEIYGEVEQLRSDLPATWKDIIRRRMQDLSSDSAGFKRGDDLFYSVKGLGNGVWGLRKWDSRTPVASDIDAPVEGDPAVARAEEDVLPEGNELPSRAEVAVYRILRDTVLTRRLKMLHKDQCQVCGTVLEFPDGTTYSEAHHIIPLGREHGGPDTPENIIILCPNCHALCDQWAIELRMEDIRQVDHHEISERSLEYHAQQRELRYEMS